jgi:hypothetical protein
MVALVLVLLVLAAELSLRGYHASTSAAPLPDSDKQPMTAGPANGGGQDSNLLPLGPGMESWPTAYTFRERM